MVGGKDISENLKKLGLDDREIEVYLTLLNKESFTIWRLSKDSGVPRSTVYRVVEDLVSKKFAEWVVGHKVQMVKAVRPKDLGSLVEEKKSEYESARESLETLQGMVKDVMSEVPQTQVRYYQGKDGLKQLLWNSLKADKEVFGYSEFGRIEVTGKSFYNKYVAEFKKRGITDRAITNEVGLEYIKKHVLTDIDRHQLEESGIRLIPEDIYYVTGDHSMYNNVYAISYWKMGEVVGVEIENPELVKMHRSIFEMLWKMAEPLVKYL